MEEIQQLLNDIQNICDVVKAKRQQQKERGEYFNIFTTMNVRTKEVRLHSAFLAELLNPKGSHGLKEKCIEKFLGILNIGTDFFLDFTKIRPNMVERYIGKVTDINGGRIDIILEDGKHAIIIENKIDTGDQPHQLLRYNNYAKKEFKNGYHILYLTMDGHEASTKSTGGEAFKYECISYDEHILNWLEQCAMLAYEKPLVRETIKQYINLIKQLTHKDMDATDTNKIVEYAIKNIEAVEVLFNSRTELSKRLRKDFIFKPLEDNYNKNGFSCIVDSTSDSPCITIYKEGWNKKICICSNKTNKTWTDMLICIVDTQKDTTGKRLAIFDNAPTDKWVYGWSWIKDPDWKDWHSTQNYSAMKNLLVFNWINEKIKSILKLEKEGTIVM